MSKELILKNSKLTFLKDVVDLCKRELDNTNIRQGPLQDRFDQLETVLRAAHTICSEGNEHNLIRIVEKKVPTFGRIEPTDIHLDIYDLLTESEDEDDFAERVLILLEGKGNEETLEEIEDEERRLGIEPSIGIDEPEDKLSNLNFDTLIDHLENISGQTFDEDVTKRLNYLNEYLRNNETHTLLETLQEGITDTIDDTTSIQLKVLLRMVEDEGSELYRK